MKKQRFSVAQRFGALKVDHVGVPVAEVIRKAGIGEQTFYRWKAQYAGLEMDQVSQMAQLRGPSPLTVNLRCGESSTKNRLRPTTSFMNLKNQKEFFHSSRLYD